MINGCECNGIFGTISFLVMLLGYCALILLVIYGIIKLTKIVTEDK